MALFPDRNLNKSIFEMPMWTVTINQIGNRFSGYIESYVAPPRSASFKSDRII
jgi:hypothetical protein